jgi:hypothetical protein
MALMSGWIAADAADADLRGRAAPLERVAVAEM